MRSETGSVALFDRRAWRLHRDRAARAAATDFLHVEVAERLVDRLGAVNRKFGDALDVGARTGALSRALARQSEFNRVVSLDPSPLFLRQSETMRVAGDPELLPFAAGGFDLIASALALNWVGDLPGALAQLRHILKPDGLFLAAMLGGGTLAELRTAFIEAELAEEGGASPRVSPTVELADAAALLLRAGFALPVADAETITVTYADPLALMRELRSMGETNALDARRRTFLRRGTLLRAVSLYAERFGLPDGRIPATFEILFLTGWAPDRSQPRPLRPGSAAHRLAEALGTVEVSAGDRATTGRRAAPAQSPSGRRQ